MQTGLRLLVVLTLLVAHGAVAEQRVISSLGRLEPEKGVVQLAGPSGGEMARQEDLSRKNLTSEELIEIDAIAAEFGLARPKRSRAEKDQGPH